jgi:hypothetical protein
LLGRQMNMLCGGLAKAAAKQALGSAEQAKEQGK